MAVAPLSYMGGAVIFPGLGGGVDLLAYIFTLSSSYIKYLGVAELGANIWKLQTARTFCFVCPHCCKGVDYIYNKMPYSKGPNNYDAWYLANRQRPLSNSSFREFQH